MEERNGDVIEAMQEPDEGRIILVFNHSLWFFLVPAYPTHIAIKLCLVMPTVVPAIAQKSAYASGGAVCLRSKR